MDRETKTELRYLKETCFMVSWFFFKEPHKAALWFKTKNPLLGNITPDYMISFGRVHKLWKFVKSCMEENNPCYFSQETQSKKIKEIKMKAKKAGKKVKK